MLTAALLLSVPLAPVVARVTMLSLVRGASALGRLGLLVPWVNAAAFAWFLRPNDGCGALFVFVYAWWLISFVAGAALTSVALLAKG